MPVPIPANGASGAIGVLDLLEAARRKEPPAWRRAMHAAATGSPMQEQDLEALLDVATNFSTPLAGVVVPLRSLARTAARGLDYRLLSSREVPPLAGAGPLAELLPTKEMVRRIKEGLIELLAQGETRLPILRHVIGPGGRSLAGQVPVRAEPLGTMSGLALGSIMEPPAGAIQLNTDLAMLSGRTPLDVIDKLLGWAVHESQHVAAMHGWPGIKGLHGWSVEATPELARRIAARPALVDKLLQESPPQYARSVLYRTNLGEVLAELARQRWLKGADYMMQHPISLTGMAPWWF